MKLNLYDTINQTWMHDATIDQIQVSYDLKNALIKDIDCGHLDKMKNSEFQQFVSELPSLVREDRLELYKYFRNHKLK